MKWKRYILLYLHPLHWIFNRRMTNFHHTVKDKTGATDCEMTTINCDSTLSNHRKVISSRRRAQIQINHPAETRLTAYGTNEKSKNWIGRGINKEEINCQISVCRPSRSSLILFLERFISARSVGLVDRSIRGTVWLPQTQGVEGTWSKNRDGVSRRSQCIRFEMFWSCLATCHSKCSLIPLRK